MQRDPKGLLLLTVCSLTNLANEIYPTALFIQLGEQKMSISIAEKRLKVNKYGQMLISINNTFADNFNEIMEVILNTSNHEINGYSKFPLLKLSEMKNVKHSLYIILVQRHHEQITKPILNLGKLDLTLLYLTGIVGKLIIYKIEIELTRNTDILGKMDPYASLQLGNRKYTTETRNDEGMHAVWNVAYEFDLKDAEEILKIDVFDKDALEDDYVCGSYIYLLKEGLLYAQDKINRYSANMIYEQTSAGIMTIYYIFEIKLDH